MIVVLVNMNDELLRLFILTKVYSFRVSTLTTLFSSNIKLNLVWKSEMILKVLKFYKTNLFFGKG